MPLADDKQVYVTNGEQVLSNSRKEDNAALHPCGHEEADTCMMFHVAHAARQILNRTSCAEQDMVRSCFFGADDGNDTGPLL